MWFRVGRLSLLAWGVAGCAPSGPTRGVAVSPPRVVPAFSFARPGAPPYSTAPVEGQLQLVFFGYTHCPDVCPTTLADWQRIAARLGPTKAARVRFLFVSVDPARDTPAIAARYAARFHPSFVGVAGNDSTTAAILTAFGASAARDASPDSTTYTVSHSAQVFLLNDRGAVIAMYPLGLGWDALLADLEALL